MGAKEERKRTTARTITWSLPDERGMYYREIKYEGSPLVHRGWVFEGDVPDEVKAWAEERGRAQGDGVLDIDWQHPRA